MKNHTTRGRLFASSMICGVAVAAIGAPALAQDETAAPVTPISSTEVQELVITGTRLRLPDYVLANPVVSIGEKEIRNSATTNLGEFLQEIPALVNSLDLAEGADTSTPSLAGVNYLDLRNLGTERTLVLVNGRRHVAAEPGSSAVDINTIPIALVERVEVLTGGASAVYGADGVSGVVNFILKDDFEGVDVRAQHGWTDEGGGGSTYFSGLVGHNFADDRANITLSYEYDNQDRVTYRDRSYTAAGRRIGLWNNPNDPGTYDSDLDDPQIPDLALASDVRYFDTSLGGSIYTNFFTAPSDSGVSFVGTGDPFDPGVYAGDFYQIGGSGSLTDLFNDDLVPGLERHSFNFTGRFEVTERVAVFGEAKYVRTNSEFSAQPSYDYGLYISPDNPFLPANVLADAETEGGFASPDLYDFGDDGFWIPWDYFGLPGPGVLVARDNFDLGTQHYDIERETTRFAIGIDAALTDTLNFQASYVRGKSERSLETSNVRINERFLAATDVVVGPGGPTCRSNLDPSAVPEGGDVFGQFPWDPSTFGTTFTPGANSGCLPLDIFGEGVGDPAAIAWINGSSTSTAEITQDVLTAFVTGDSSQWFALPAGPLSFVLGGEYRKEQSDYQPSPLETMAENLDYAGFSTLGRGIPTLGEFDVKELFTELSAPLLRDMPFAQSLVVRAAYRWSEYSTAGETNTWDFGARWQINDWVMLRGTRARAVRAPNIDDLFLGRSQVFSTFADPCSTTNLGGGPDPALREANCADNLTALGIDPATFINNSSEAVGGFISGNPDLVPETADTKTWGIVLTPRIFPGLTVSVDYYDIEIDDAIQSFTGQTIVNNCYDLPQPNDFCALFERTPTGFNPGRITTFEQLPQNIATYTTRGYDFSAIYNIDPADMGVTQDIGTFSMRVLGNKLEELTFDQGGTAQPTNDLGAIGAPEWQVNADLTWEYHDWMVNYGFSWFAHTRRFSRATMANEPDYVADESLWYYPARKVQDIQVRYTFDDRFTVYTGVNNLTNQPPALSAYEYPVSPVGRLYYVGVNANF